MVRKNKKNNVIKIICYILILLFIVGVFFTIFSLTGGFKSPIKSFYLTCDGKILIDEDNIILYADKSCSLKYNVLAVDNEDTTYNVKVVGNFDEDLTFYVDGQPYGFSGIEDFSKYFNIKKENNIFTLNINEDFSIISILKDLYQGKEVVFFENIDLTSCFKLVVTGSNNKDIVVISLIIFVPVDSIELDKSEVIL